jgi:hypothetical protein
MTRKLFGAVAATAMLVTGSAQAEVWSGFFRDATTRSSTNNWPGFYRGAVVASPADADTILRSPNTDAHAAARSEFLTGLFPQTNPKPGRLDRTTETTVESIKLQSSAEVASALATDKAGPRGSLRVAAGYYDVIAGDDEAASFSAEYHLGRAFWWVDPFGGLMITTEGALYGYAGLALDIVIADRVAITPSAAVGAYHDGGGKDLGHWVEFRTGAEMAYIFPNQSRLGLAFYHMSNAGLGRHNPGVEILQLSYSAPLAGLF